MYGLSQHQSFIEILATNVDVSGASPHGVTYIHTYIGMEKTRRRDDDDDDVEGDERTGR